MSECRDGLKTYPWCVVCLGSDLRMCSIENIKLLEIYKKLTDSQPPYGIPQLICYVCYSVLQRSLRFSEMARRSQKILEGLLHQGIEAQNIQPTPNFGLAQNLSISEISTTSLPDTSKDENEILEDHTSMKVEEMGQLEIKIEELPEDNEMINSADLADVFNNEVSINHSSIIKTEEPMVEETGTQSHLPSHIFNYITKPYKYEISDETFSQPDSKTFLKHTEKKNIRTHTKEKTNIKTHTEKIKHKNKILYESLTKKNDLETNSTTITGEEQFQCNMCNKIFMQRRYLQRHMRIHTGKKPHKCKICHKKFTQYFNMQIHERIHTGEKPYKCNECDKTFSQSQSLKCHMRTHTGEKPYKCDICNNTFCVLVTLQRHIRTHTGERPYKCKMCNKTFAQRSCLGRHIRTHAP